MRPGLSLGTAPDHDLKFCTSTSFQAQFNQTEDQFNNSECQFKKAEHIIKIDEDEVKLYEKHLKKDEMEIKTASVEYTHSRYYQSIHHLSNEKD